MTHTVSPLIASLPTSPDRLAEHVTTVVPHGQPTLLDRLTTQLGNARTARQLLADAYDAHAAQLRATA